MAIPVKKISAQIQLSDDIKRQYPTDAVVSLLIQQLANVPELTGNANKILGINNEATAIEFIDKPAGAGAATFTLVSDFPGNPANNQLVFLTRARGSNAIGFYQYRVNQWVALFTQTTDFVLPVGTQLPAVVTNNSIFFLTATHLTNTPGVYYGAAGPPQAWVKIASVFDNTAATANLNALTARVVTLEADNPVTTLVLAGNTLTVTKKDGTTEDIALPAGGGGQAQLAQTAIFYGNTARRAQVDDEDDAESNAQIEAQNAFNDPTARNAQNVYLQTGGLITITFPAPAGYYRPWFAVPIQDINNLRIYSSDNDNENESWTNQNHTLNGVVYTVYVRIIEIEQGEDKEWIIKDFA